MTYLLDMSPSEAVANGAQLLDERLPGWWRKISLHELDLTDCGDCVCGQLADTAAVQAFAEDDLVVYSAYDQTTRFLRLEWSVMNGLWFGERIGKDYDYGFNVKPRRDFPRDSITHKEWESLCGITFWALEAEWRIAIVTRLEADKLQDERREYGPRGDRKDDSANAEDLTRASSGERHVQVGV